MQHAFAYIPIVDPPSYEGTEVIINVWEPHVGPSDFSLAQLWFMNTGISFPVNSPNYNILNTIEAGWQVNKTTTTTNCFQQLNQCWVITSVVQFSDFVKNLWFQCFS
jgi:hypothetical protein